MQPASATTGTKAGNPLGDAVYNLIQSKALLECDARLASEGLENVVAIAPQDVDSQGTGGTRAEQASYFDDVIFFVNGDSREDIYHKSIRVSQVVLSVFQAHGMVLNFGKGKTEFIFLLQGHRARVVRKRLAAAGGLQVLLPSGETTIKVTATYKHMGTVVSAGRRISLEVSSRTGQAYAAVRESRTRFYMHPAVYIKAKFVAAECCVESKLLYNAGTWGWYHQNCLRGSRRCVYMPGVAS